MNIQIVCCVQNQPIAKLLNICRKKIKKVTTFLLFNILFVCIIVYKSCKDTINKRHSYIKRQFD